MKQTAECHDCVTRASCAAPVPRAGVAADRAGRVYPCRATGVKLGVVRAPVGRLLVLCSLAAAGLAGCALPQASPGRQNAAAPAANDHPVGVWYYLPAGADRPGELAAALEHDFAVMAQLGLGTVLLRICPPESLPTVCRAAQRHELRVVAPDPAATRFVRSGLGQERVLAGPGEFPSHPALTGRLIGSIVNARTIKRAATVAEAARTASAPRALWAQLDWADAAPGDLAAIDYLVHASPSASGAPPKAPPASGGLQTVVCKVLRGQEEVTSRTWLADYHRGLLRGETAGVVFDSYRTLPGKYQGLVERNEPVGPERAATVRKIASRAAAWGPVLAGLKPEPLAAGTPAPHLRFGLLAGGTRRCLLVVNESPTQFVHRQWTCPLPLGRGPVTRAVAVPTAENMLPGQVLTVGADGLVIPLDLAPGEAALFELF